MNKTGWRTFSASYRKRPSERDRKPAADCYSSFCYDAAMRGLGSIDSLSSILEGLARRLGLESKLLESRLRRNWGSIVGEPIASNTWPTQVRYKKLYLLVHNSVWLHQLTFLKPTLLHKLNSVAGGELVTEIVLRVGEIPSRAAASATTPPIDGDSTVSEVVLAEVSPHVSAIQDPDLRRRFTEAISRYPSQAPHPPGGGPSRVP